MDLAVDSRDGGALRRESQFSWAGPFQGVRQPSPGQADGYSAGTQAGNRGRAANDTVSLIEDNSAWQDKWRTGTSV